MSKLDQLREMTTVVADTGDIDAVRRLYGAASGKITVATNPSGLKLRVDGALVDDGTQFEAAVPEFILAMPRVLH